MALTLPGSLVPKRIGDRLAALCRLPAGTGRERGPGLAPAPCLPRPVLLEPVAETLGLTVAALEDVFAEAARSGHNPFRRLAEVHKADPALAACALAKALGLPYLETIPVSDADAERLRALPFAYLKRNLAVPFTDNNGRLVLALADPFSPELADDVRRMLGAPDLEPALALPETILAAINHAFGQAEADGETRLGDVSLDDFMGPPPENMSTEDLLDETSNAPVIRLVNQLLTQAVRDLCSDIHIEPYQNSLKIRFRLDGVLYDIKTLDKRWHPPVVSHVKIRSKLDIAERRLPQDGSFDIRLGNRNVDIRVSVFPTKFGERLVLRLLEKNQPHLEP
ncbi:Type IV fimbrial assembly, ATPase PilB [Desulfovibrio sp. DV]|uniref:GspE/PulE family protein n=1 Tax=Desulfovibrio sp. DV TaxID=1844708 RepID=UPI000963ADA1|nr:ATPase, T2SS/T4P/T4SS family [Desulfovibrio sp. DV]OLN30262.1 Type IV fimbrial assembly, ATPase PilB [Desulfovibrio sp. DV]